MPYTIIVESTDAIPEDQIALMSQTLNVLGEDPAVHYARWTQSTGTSYECEIGITVDRKHLTLMTGKLPSPPVYSPHRDFLQGVKSVTITTSSSAPDAKAECPYLVSEPAPTPRADKGRIWPATFLGPWRFPRGKDGKSRRWKRLKMDLSNDYPLLLGLGTPVRSELVNRGHMGQLVRAWPCVGMRKYFPLLPEAQACWGQLEILNARE
ncbi:hypothetical protein L873DRAFT_1795681 [Choiromyces venosus 120613-1]|uniref:Uncharacterized protein n=1 Tax=Choiromyces venosus 120613-1 TaxID=1336337 RepID=A0A3N4IV65_9PEZI|nr:hypothetical protein L873DRAFT_1795681 [Choiromyces venosus 120613-1]